MRRVLALSLLLLGTAHAERPPTSATAAVDNLIEDLLAKRYLAAANGLAAHVTLANLELRGDCKKQFPDGQVMRSAALAKCLATAVKWPVHRLVASESKTRTGWEVVLEDVRFDVRRPRSGKGYEVFAISLPSRLGR